MLFQALLCHMLMSNVADCTQRNRRGKTADNVAQSVSQGPIGHLAAYPNIPEEEYHEWQHWQHWGPQGEPYQYRTDRIEGDDSNALDRASVCGSKQSFDVGSSAWQETSVYLTSWTGVETHDSDGGGIDPYAFIDTAWNRPRASASSSHDPSASDIFDGSDEESFVDDDFDDTEEEEEVYYDFEDDQIESTQTNSVNKSEKTPSKWRIATDNEAETRAIFDFAWRQKGLSYDMPPEKLALEIAKIKVEYGRDRGIGRVAYKRIKASVPEKVYDKFQVMTVKYSRRLRRLWEKANTNALFSEEDKVNYVFDTVGKTDIMQFKPRSRSNPSSLAATRAVNEKAEKAWSIILGNFPRQLRKQAIQDPKSISTVDIEKYSRDLQIDGIKSETAKIGYIKRYMTNVLDKDKDQLVKFSSLRLKFRQGKEKLIREEKQDRKRIELGLPPIIRRKKIADQD